MSLIIDKSNNIGVLASSVCLIHCVATPFLFVAQLCTKTCCDAAPLWWSVLDYVFFIVAFFAVYQSTRTTSNRIIAIGLWLSLIVLMVILLNEKIELFTSFENAIYLPTLSLIVLHLCNRKYCRCKTNNCCANQA